MIALDDYQSLLRKVQELEKEKERSLGVYKELLKELKQAWGCKTLAEAKVKLEKMKKQEQILAKKYFKAKKIFLKKYGHLLKDN